MGYLMQSIRLVAGGQLPGFTWQFGPGGADQLEAITRCHWQPNTWAATWLPQAACSKLWM